MATERANKKRNLLIVNALIYMQRTLHLAQASHHGALAKCHACGDTETKEISYELIRKRWVVWCGCGNASDGRESLSRAVINWNRKNTSGN